MKIAIRLSGLWLSFLACVDNIEPQVLNIQKVHDNSSVDIFRTVMEGEIRAMSMDSIRSIMRELSVNLTSSGDDNAAREGQDIVSNNDLN